MLRLRKSSERGRGHLDWLESWFSFSFDQYYDARHMRWSALRVLNEDIIAPGGGFDMHPHRDMEIISYILEGSLRHKDNLGHESVVTPGEIQVMTAGSGILHSEFNPEKSIKTHMLQIWIMPAEKSRQPAWSQHRWDDRAPDSRGLILLASPDGRDQSARVGQDVLVWQVGHSGKGSYKLALTPDRKGWLQIAGGSVTVQGTTQTIDLSAGDAVAIEEESVVELSNVRDLNALWFDLP